jgi:hypothetical protein
MSNGNDNFTKVYRGTPNAFDFLQVGTLDVNTTNSTIINGQQYVTVTGYAPTSFSALAGATTPGATTGALSLLKSAGGVAATSPTDSRLLTLPANAVVTRVLVSNNGTAISAAGSFNIGFKPITGATTDVTFSPATANCPVVALTTAIAGASATSPVAIADFGSLSAVAVPPTSLTCLAINSTNYGVLLVPNNGATTTSPSLVNVYNTGTTLTTGALKVQITYQIFSS